jgi:serine/threonine protein phosphatase PrpC
MKTESAFCSKAAGRAHNEDSAGYSIHSKLNQSLAVVADGMGGHGGGDIASKETVACIISYFDQCCESGNPFDPTAAMEAAAYRLQEVLKSGRGTSGMGTTVVLAHVSDQVVRVAHVGDSRALVVHSTKREAFVRRVTTDHLKLVEMGYSDVEAKNMPDGNVLSRALTAGKVSKVELSEFERKQGQLIILISDGVGEYVNEEELVGCVARGSLQEAADKVVATAVKNGTTDNATAAVVRL